MGADQVPILRLMIGLLALEFYLDSGRQPRRRQVRQGRHQRGGLGVDQLRAGGDIHPLSLAHRTV